MVNKCPDIVYYFVYISLETEWYIFHCYYYDDNVYGGDSEKGNHNPFFCFTRSKTRGHNCDSKRNTDIIFKFYLIYLRKKNQDLIKDYGIPHTHTLQTRFFFFLTLAFIQAIKDLPTINLKEKRS